MSDNWTKYLKSKYIPQDSPFAAILPDDEPLVKLKEKYLVKENDLAALQESDLQAGNITGK